MLVVVVRVAVRVAARVVVRVVVWVVVVRSVVREVGGRTHLQARLVQCTARPSTILPGPHTPGCPRP